jgi:hypothetical protein
MIFKCFLWAFLVRVDRRSNDITSAIHTIPIIIQESFLEENEFDSLNSTITNYSTNSFFKYKEGRDERYDILYNETIDNSMILNITRFFTQMELLNILESKNISQHEKVKRVEIYNHDNYPSKYVGNIKAGSLFKDWDADI